MGNYTIVISGTGQHHNGMAEDADMLARDLARRLVEHGHTLDSATICAGGSDDLLPVPTEGTDAATETEEGSAGGEPE